MRNTLIIVAVVIAGLQAGCNSRPQKLPTRSAEVGEARLVIQKLPDDYSPAKNASYIDYFRMLITVPEELTDSASVSYSNYDIVRDFSIIAKRDTLGALFFQRIANGKNKCYEYIAAFDNRIYAPDGNFSIRLRDKVFGLGDVTLNFNAH